MKNRLSIESSPIDPRVLDARDGVSLFDGGLPSELRPATRMRETRA